jgi:Tol biopolymer transport system component
MHRRSGSRVAAVSARSNAPIVGSVRPIRPTSLAAAAVAVAAATGCGGSETSQHDLIGSSGGRAVSEKPTCAKAQTRQLVFGEGLSRGVRNVSSRADGSGRVDLTHGGNFGKGLSISPDGCRVAYVAEGDLLPNGQERTPKLLITNADGSGDTQTALPGLYDQSDLSWSPDGRQIAIANDRGLTVFDVRSGQSKDIDVGALIFVGSPSWSPDGKRIAFAGATEQDVSSSDNLIEPDVYVAGVDGGGSQLLRHTPRYYEQELAWSPDGRWIAFIDSSASTEDTFGPADHYRRGVFLISPDGKTFRRLTPTTGSRPSWLPDSSAVVYARNECHGGPPASFGPCSGQTIVAVPLNGGPDQALIGPEVGVSFPGPEYARSAGMPSQVR